MGNFWQLWLFCQSQTISMKMKIYWCTFDRCSKVSLYSFISIGSELETPRNETNWAIKVANKQLAKRDIVDFW